MARKSLLNEYWKQIGGTVMLPGANRAADRFARASFYINAVEQSGDPRAAAAAVFSVIRNVSVPRGISTPGQPNISSTIWRTVADQKNKVYFFDSSTSPNTFWVPLADLDFAPGAPVMKLTIALITIRLMTTNIDSLVAPLTPENISVPLSGRQRRQAWNFD